MKKVVTFFILAFFLFYVITDPDGFTDAINTIADFIRTVFENLVDAFDALFS